MVALALHALVCQGVHVCKRKPSTDPIHYKYAGTGTQVLFVFFLFQHLFHNFRRKKKLHWDGEIDQLANPAHIFMAQVAAYIIKK